MPSDFLVNLSPAGVVYTTGLTALIVIEPSAVVGVVITTLSPAFTLTLPLTGLTSVPLPWIVQISSVVATFLVPVVPGVAPGVVYSIRLSPVL